MKKPTEDEVYELMVEYAPKAFRLQKISPFEINWELEATKLIDHFEETAAPNGDWLRGKSKQRITDWRRTVMRWVRSEIEWQSKNVPTAGRPVPTYTPPAPGKQTPEAARKALESFLRGEA